MDKFSASYDIIVSSVALKKTIVSRIKELNINGYLLCKDLDIHYAHFITYLKEMNADRFDNIRLTQNQLIRIAERLEIHPIVTFKIKPSSEVKLDRIMKEGKYTRKITNSVNKAKRYFEEYDMDFLNQ